MGNCLTAFTHYLDLSSSLVLMRRFSECSEKYSKFEVFQYISLLTLRGLPPSNPFLKIYQNFAFLLDITLVCPGELYNLYGKSAFEILEMVGKFWIKYINANLYNYLTYYSYPESINNKNNFCGFEAAKMYCWFPKFTMHFK